MRYPRTASVSTAWLAVASLGVLAGLVTVLLWDTRKPGGPVSTEPLVVYCAAGLQEPMAAVAREYEQAFGVPVQVQYGGSQTLLANMEVSKRGDLYVPADQSYIQLARDKGLIDETLPLAHMTPVLVVAKGNPKNIRGLDDLKREDVRLAQANPDAAAVGKLVRAALQKSGHWKDLNARTIVFKTTVNDVANDVKVGSADAGFVWDANLSQYPDLEAVPVTELQGTTSNIAAAVLHGTTQPTAALRFARFLAARDRGLKEFQKSGFLTVEGDVWAEHPEVKLFAGAMLQAAIDKTIADFQKREGVQVITIYNGCGLLVDQMKVGERPDAYFACDKSFMTQVHDLFLDSTDLSTNELVIVVQKGNPHGLHTLDDLKKPGIRIGVGDEHKCALGALTQTTLRQGGVRAPVMENVTVQVAKGDDLVTALRAKALDAAIAYVSNAKAAGDDLEYVKVDLPCAIAVQPMAVGKASSNKYLTGRLMDALRSQTSRDRFVEAGFHWKEAKK